MSTCNCKATIRGEDCANTNFLPLLLFMHGKQLHVIVLFSILVLWIRTILAKICFLSHQKCRILNWTLLSEHDMKSWLLQFAGVFPVESSNTTSATTCSVSSKCQWSNHFTFIIIYYYSMKGLLLGKVHILCVGHNFLYSRRQSIVGLLVSVFNILYRQWFEKKNYVHGYD